MDQTESSETTEHQTSKSHENKKMTMDAVGRECLNNTVDVLDGNSNHDQRVGGSKKENVDSERETENVRKDNNTMSVSTTSGRVNDMTVSHAESGYLSDSITSSKDRDSIHENCASANSETDVTPCGENLMLFSDSSNTTSLQSPNADSTVINDHRDCLNTASGDCNRIEQLQSLASLDLNDVSKEMSAIDDIFATNFAINRPDSLLVQNSRAGSEGNRSRSKSGDTSTKSEQNTEHCESRKRSKSSAFPIAKQKEGVNITEDMLSKSLPHGKVVRRDTGLIEFIADDLQEKIRRSSPMSKTASEVSSSRRSSDLSITSVESYASSSMATSMTSGMSRSYPQSPDCIPPIDPTAIHEIENQARLVAVNLDHMMGNLSNNLHKMSAISVGCEEAYKTSVDVTCDSVDSSIKSMYALMAKCEELTQTMQPVYKLAEQIKDIKRLLDRFESQLGDKP